MPLINKLVRMAENATTQYGQVTRIVNNTSFTDTVTINLHIDDPQDLYTSGDIISGEVTVVLKREIDISEISLKYKIDETTQLLQVEDQRSKRQEQVTFKSAARIYEKGVRLFPLEHDIGNLNMQRLTLPPGTHTYPFSVRIPGHQKDGYKALPPSFEDPEYKGSINHTLKVTLKRASSFKQNSRYEHPLKFMPRASPGEFSEYRWIGKESRVEYGSMFNRHNLALKASVSFPLGAQTGATVPLQLIAEAVGGAKFTVVDVAVELIGHSNIIAQQRSEQHCLRYVLAQRNLGQEGSRLDLTNQLGQISLPCNLVPSFQTKFIKMQYTIQFTIRVAAGSNKKITTLQFGEELRVLGPQVFQQQPPQNQPQHPQKPIEQHSTQPNQYPPEKQSYSQPGAPEQEHPPAKPSRPSATQNNPFSKENMGKIEAGPASPSVSTSRPSPSVPNPAPSHTNYNEENPEEPPPAYSTQ